MTTKIKGPQGAISPDAISVNAISAESIVVPELSVNSVIPHSGSTISVPTGYKLQVEKIADTNGSVAIDIAKVAGKASRYTRQAYTQYDTANRSFSTSWALGPTFANKTDFKAGSLVEVSYYLPLRNDATGWGGAYIEPQITFNNGATWLSCGSSGYNGVMEYGQSIHYYDRNLLIDPALESITTDFQFNIRFYLRSYDGTLTMVTSNAINTISGTATAANGANYYQHFPSILVRELAILRGNS